MHYKIIYCTSKSAVHNNITNNYFYTIQLYTPSAFWLYSYACIKCGNLGNSAFLIIIIVLLHPQTNVNMSLFAFILQLRFYINPNYETRKLWQLILWFKKWPTCGTHYYRGLYKSKHTVLLKNICVNPFQNGGKSN